MVASSLAKQMRTEGLHRSLKALIGMVAKPWSRVHLLAKSWSFSPSSKYSETSTTWK
jgi:hypothetical protein